MELTTETLNKMMQNDDWAGFGYVGERRNHLDNTELVARADGMLLDHAESRQMTEEQLFQWANSKHGRWYGDCWFGANGQHAEKYLPKI